MKSSLYFFMTHDDLTDFLSAFPADDFGVTRDENSNIQWFFRCGEESIQLLFSTQYDSILTEGRIAIRTDKRTNDDVSVCENTYKKMRSWIKKRYSNKTFCYNAKTQTRDIGETQLNNRWWVSPAVEALSRSGEIILKQSKNSFVVFEMQDNI